ncbi:hypothetical protein LXA43DRAFT_1098540 [Ganoderma leucocontextum]|nr:hypothetical protein LXA43DRAFT_1098540 [Ganoderma leucocontextum]
MPETRSQRKNLVQMAAFTTEIKDIHQFTTEEDINAFAQCARANPDVGRALEHLTINLDTFTLVPNLTDLILILHPSTPRTILNNVTFSKLVLFKTDLLHNYLVSFFAVHTSVRLVDLGPCGKVGKCALTSVNFSRLHNICCPVECFMAIIHLSFIRIRGDLTYESTSMSSVLRSFAIPHFALYVLSLHFWPDDMDILTSIVAFAPMIRTLRLWEKRRRTGSAPHALCPWQNPKQWRNTLLQLQHLEQFVIQTTASFISAPGLVQEH